MKVCLQCKDEIVGKRDNAVFCSGKCKVKHHRQNRDRSKSLNAEQRLTIIYNKILEALSTPEIVKKKEKAFEDLVNYGEAVVEPMFNKEQSKQMTFQQMLNKIAELQFPDEKEEFAVTINNSTLSETEKKKLLQNLWYK